MDLATVEIAQHWTFNLKRTLFLAVSGYLFGGCLNSSGHAKFACSAANKLLVNNSGLDHSKGICIE